VLYCRIENETLAQLVVIGGAHVAWQGRPLVQSAARSDFFEWRRQDGQEGMMNSAPAELPITASLEGLPNLLSASHNSSNPSSSDQGSFRQGSPNQSSPSRAPSPYAEKH
jgi:hypothetical protein